MMIDEKSGVEVKTRKKALKSFSDCFVGMLSLLILFYLTWSLGSELVTWLADKFHLSRVVAVDVGKATPTITKKKKSNLTLYLGAKMMADGFISHVTEAYPFADEQFFYRFNYVIIITRSRLHE